MEPTPVSEKNTQPPVSDGRAGLQILRTLIGKRSPLAALEVMHAQLGNVFQIPLKGFQSTVLVGPTSNRSVLITDRDKLLWRNERDPVTKLLRRGILVQDGKSHDDLRALMAPFLRRGRVASHVEEMWRLTDQITDVWVDGEHRDMLVEMRRVALLILMQSLFAVDFRPHLEPLWSSILRVLDYISPGLWILWPGVPRPGYQDAIGQLDAYLYAIIRERRSSAKDSNDLLSCLVNTPGLDDDLVRDQLLTLLIAGHDTSTAALAWTLYLLGSHPSSLARARDEVDQVLGYDPPSADQLAGLVFLEQVFKETLRLYPPIHVGNRFVTTDLSVEGYTIPAGTRVMCSIYLTHRSAQYWEKPTSFMPERFAEDQQDMRAPLTYVPFGAGPRNCIGAAFAQVEAKVVLARLLQTFDLDLVSDDVHPHMGATLEPRPGVTMHVRRRNKPPN
jgi:cytochrome P450